MPEGRIIKGNKFIITLSHIVAITYVRISRGRFELKNGAIVFRITVITPRPAVHDCFHCGTVVIVALGQTRDNTSY